MQSKWISMTHGITGQAQVALEREWTLWFCVLRNFKCERYWHFDLLWQALQEISNWPVYISSSQQSITRQNVVEKSEQSCLVEKSEKQLHSYDSQKETEPPYLRAMTMPQEQTKDSQTKVFWGPSHFLFNFLNMSTLSCQTMMIWLLSKSICSRID